MFQGSAGPKSLRISRSLARAVFSVNSFALFMWWREFEAYSLSLKLTQRSVIKQVNTCIVLYGIIGTVYPRVVPLLLWGLYSTDYWWVLIAEIIKSWPTENRAQVTSHSDMTPPMMVILILYYFITNYFILYYVKKYIYIYIYIYI